MAKISKTCEFCGSEFFVDPHRKDTARFCTKPCADKYPSVSGPEHPCWKGGRIIRKNGYACVRVDGRYVYEHRHVMSLHLGRTLRRDEHVHHKDGDPLNNRLDNLRLVLAAEHNREHTRERWRNGSLRPHYVRMSPQKDKLASELRAAGWTIRKISERIGVTRASVYRGIARHRSLQPVRP